MAESILAQKSGLALAGPAGPVTMVLALPQQVTIRLQDTWKYVKDEHKSRSTTAFERSIRKKTRGK